MPKSLQPSEHWAPTFDRPGLLSPRREIQAELERVEASSTSPTFEPLRHEKVQRLRELLQTATEHGALPLIATDKGGSWKKVETG